MREFSLVERDLQQHASGAIRDTTEGKINYLLAMDGPMFDRYAEHMSKAAASKGRRNWTKAGDDPETAQADLDRGFESLMRHTRQYLKGDTDEDHAAAINFNLDWIETVAGKMRGRGQEIDWNGHALNP